MSILQKHYKERIKTMCYLLFLLLYHYQAKKYISVGKHLGTC